MARVLSTRTVAVSGRVAQTRAISAPTDLTGCVLWLSAYDTSSMTKDGAGVVSQWNDKSGQVNHATEATAGRRPVYALNTLNGIPGLTSTRAADTRMLLNGSTGVVLSGACSLFLVTTANATGAGSSYFTDDNTATNSFISRFSGSLLEWYGTAGERVTLSSAPTAAWHCMSVCKNALRSILRYDRAEIARVPPLIVVTTQKSIFNIQTTGAAVNAAIAEVVYYNRALADGERLQVERLLMSNAQIDTYDAQGAGGRVAV